MQQCDGMYTTQRFQMGLVVTNEGKNVGWWIQQLIVDAIIHVNLATVFGRKRNVFRVRVEAEDLSGCFEVF